MDDILKLKEMFPDTPVPIIHKTYTQNNCFLMDTCEELLLTSMQDTQSPSYNFLGTSSSGGAQGKNPDEDVIRISDEDEDKSGKDSEFSLKISYDKFNYLRAIFPDVQIPYLKQNLDEIGDDDTKFQVFLNDCLTDPKRLPRHAKVTPSTKRSRQSDDKYWASLSSLVDAGSEQETGTTEEPSSSKKLRTDGKRKGLVKVVKSSKDHADDFECSLCHCSLVVKWVKCLAGCIFCIPCFTKRFHDRLTKDVNNTECFLLCGEMFSEETLKTYLSPVLFDELVAVAYDTEYKDQDDEDSDVVLDVAQSSKIDNNLKQKNGKEKSTENKAEVEIVKESSHRHVQPPTKAKASMSSTRIDLSMKIGKFDKLRCPQCQFSGKMTHSQEEVRCNKCKKSSCRTCLNVKGPRHLCSDSKMRELKAEMEHALLRLAILSQTNPRDNSMKDLVEDSVNEFQVENPNNKDRDVIKALEAHHTSYFISNRQSNGWNKTHKSSQKIKDKEIIKHLEALYADIDMLKICTSTYFLNECVDLLEQSALIPFIETMIDSCNFLEIGNHSDVYKALIKILKIFCQKESFHSLMAKLRGQKVSIQKLIEKLGKAAKVIMDKVSGADVGVAQDIYELSIEASETLCKGDKLVSLFEDQRKDASSSNDECDIMELEEEPEKTEDYMGALIPLQYDDSVSFQSVTLKHAEPPSKKTVIRIAHELSSFATSSTLPCSASSTIFVRSDNSKMNFVKAVITGPSDSPYMGGIYEFDIEFPPSYPSVPPLVTFKTTAGGRVRFNPNLYACGKVCLSLLGTWSGEKWIPNTSTLLQVLVSIQSLVLVADPFYNEPGYADGHYPAQSKNYNKTVFTNNLRHAILEQLAKPPQGFDEVVRKHFFHRRESLIKELDEYVKQFSVAGTSAKKPKGYSTSISKKYGQLMTNIENWTAMDMFGAVGVGAISHQVQGDLSELVAEVKAELMKLEKPITKNN